MSNFPRIWDRARERKIIGETKVSWIVEVCDWLPPLKVFKKNPNKGHHIKQWFFDEAERDLDVWADHNFMKIKESLGGYSRKIDAVTLQKVADVLGYVEEK